MLQGCDRKLVRVTPFVGRMYQIFKILVLIYTVNNYVCWTMQIFSLLVKLSITCWESLPNNIMSHLWQEFLEIINWLITLFFIKCIYYGMEFFFQVGWRNAFSFYKFWYMILVFLSWLHICIPFWGLLFGIDMDFVWSCSKGLFVN